VFCCLMLSSRSHKGHITWEVFHRFKEGYPLQRSKLYLPYLELQAIAVLATISEERNSGNPHATYRGNRRWVTAAGTRHYKRSVSGAADRAARSGGLGNADGYRHC
jgi:hypothetical protein